MKKSKKVLIIIAIVLAVLLVVAYTVLYVLFPTQTPYYTNLVIDYICNKPLPVIGISTLVLFVMVFKVVRFIVANKGKKYSELQGQIDTLRNDLKQASEDAERYKQIAYNLCEVSNQNLKRVCDAIPNKKVKAIGEELYGEETKEETNH